jgi:hypothetical protein
MHLNVYYRRTDALNRRRDGPRISIEQAGVARFGSSDADRFLRQTAVQRLVRRERFHEKTVTVHAA